MKKSRYTDEPITFELKHVTCPPMHSYETSDADSATVHASPYQLTKIVRRHLLPINGNAALIAVPLHVRDKRKSWRGCRLAAQSTSSRSRIQRTALPQRRET